MFPVIPILAWTGGIAAGAQVLGGFVRGTGELVRGRPGNALREVAGGCLDPVKTACHEVSKLGHDMYMVVMKPWRDPAEIEVAEAPEEIIVVKRQRRPRKCEATELESASVDGVLSVGTEG